MPFERTFLHYFTTENAITADLRNYSLIYLNASNCTASTNILVTAGVIIRIPSTMGGRTIKFTVYPNSHDDSGEITVTPSKIYTMDYNDRRIFSVVIAKDAHSGISANISRVYHM